MTVLYEDIAIFRGHSILAEGPKKTLNIM